MKTLMILPVLLILLVACKNDKTTPGPSGPVLTGTWKWVLTSGGIAGIQETPASTGRNMKYTFGSSSLNITTDTSSVNTPYTISKITTVGNTIYLMNISAFALQQSYRSYNDTLVISDYGISDGFSRIFVKQ